MANQRRRPPVARVPAGRRRKGHYAWMRRGIQAAALIVFLGSLFWVCWPYSARPARSWTGWMPVGFDAPAGRLTVASGDKPSAVSADLPVIGQSVFVLDDGLEKDGDLGRFEVVKVEPTELILAADGPLAADRLKQLEAALGPWSLHEAPPGGWPSHFADDLAAKEKLPAETFLLLDPLAGISAALASGHWTNTLLWTAAILAACLVVPRGFCGYLCPLGALSDLFDWIFSRRLPWHRLRLHRWPKHVRFLVLAAVLGAAASGVLLAGFVSAIPLLTRGLVAAVSPLQLGLWRGWHQVPSVTGADVFSIVLLAAVVALGLLRPRFWCRCLCPTGAVFSIGTLAALFRRRVDHRCGGCGRCAEACPFGAIDSSPHDAPLTDCAFCRTCASVCPTDAVQFVARWNRPAPKGAGKFRSRHGSRERTPRRTFLTTALSGAIAAIGGGGVAAGTRAMGGAVGAPPLVRPPGSVPEEIFLQRCLRCGACLQACPNQGLRPAGFAQGVEALWTPHLVPDAAGCEASCNRCGQVCPTGAIRPLELEEKRAARMGLAIIDPRACLPHASHGDCRLCVDECAAAGYAAIEVVRVGTQLDASGKPIEDSGYLAPVVAADRCVGCGMCQCRCHTVNVAQKRLLSQTAIVVHSGADREDRRLAGSYVELRAIRLHGSQRLPVDRKSGQDDYLPQF